MKPRPFWFRLGQAAQAGVVALLLLGAALGYLLATKLAPFRYMEF